MSIQEKISALADARNKIRNWLLGLGLATSTDKLDDLATKIAAIVDHGAVNVQILEGTSYTIPAGYHDGNGIVMAVTDTAGEEQKYLLQPVVTVTPTKTRQSISSGAGYYGLTGVTVEAIPEAYQDVTHTTAEEDTVLANKIFVKADGSTGTGTMPNNGKVTKNLDATTTSYTIAKGYHNGEGSVSVKVETKSVTPIKSSQTVAPSAGSLLSKVTVEAIPDKYGDVTDASHDNDGSAAAFILEGNQFLANSGGQGVAAMVVGEMPNNGSVEVYLGLTNEAYAVPVGYHNGGGSVSLDSSIEEALAAI